MMKRVLLVVGLIVFSCSNNVKAMDGLKNCFVRFGQAIEKVDNVPVVGKLTNFFPFKIIATTFKDYPIPTMIALTSVFMYILSRNESVRRIFNKYTDNGVKRLARQELNNQKFDETLFIFDGEDEEEQVEKKDVLLSDSVLNDEDFDKSHNQFAEYPNLKFL